MRRLRDIAAGSVLTAALLAGCAPSGEEADFIARKASLQRQNQGIRDLIAEAENGSLIPADRFLVGIGEEMLAELLTSQLPMERPLGKRFVVRLERATVLLRDKFGLVTIEGDIHRHNDPNHRTAVRVIGGLGTVQIDPDTKLLSMSIAIDRFELLQAGRLEKVLGAGGRKFLAEKGRGVLQSEMPTLKVPVALAQNIRIPAIMEGPIQLDSLAVPLDLSVERILAAGGKLWLTLRAEVGEVAGAEEGLGVVYQKKVRSTGGGR
jgi:hypothetical protein